MNGNGAAEIRRLAALLLEHEIAVGLGFADNGKRGATAGTAAQVVKKANEVVETACLGKSRIAALGSFT